MKVSRTIVNSRREKILEAVQNDGNVSVNDLAERFSVSLLTVRRDLQYLEDHNLLERFYGGARASTKLTEPNGPNTKSIRREKIARYAAGLLADGDTIFINTSSTALSMVKYITKKNITIITNNGNIINTKNPSQATVVLLGGELRYKKMKVTVKKSFIGCGGLCPETGMTTELLNEVNLNQTMFERVTKASYILADSAKIGRRVSFVSCPTDRIENIITDKDAPADIINEFREQGILVHLVD